MNEEGTTPDNFKEPPAVELYYYLSMCKASVPKELQSGQFVTVDLVDTNKNPLQQGQNDQPLQVPVEALSFNKVLEQKKKEVKEHLEGVYPVVILGVETRRRWLLGKTTKRYYGLPAVLQVMQDGEEPFRLLGVQDTGAERKVLRGATWGSPKLGDMNIHFVLGDGLSDSKK